MTENSLTIHIHTDGSCRGNPGPGGYAGIIQIPRHSDIHLRGHRAATTNNQMEMMAVIHSLEHLQDLVNTDGLDVEVHTDSEYVCNGFNKNWLVNWQKNGWRTAGKKPVANRELWQRLLELTQAPSVTFTHVRGHSGDPMNELCDRLANEETDRAVRGEPDGQQDFLEDGGAAPAAGRTPEPESMHPDPGASPEYARGYREGYEAAKRDMANALNGMAPQVQEPPSDLPF